MPALAMHISNGIINNQVALLFAGVALAGLALCFVMGRRELDDRLVPMAGLVAAFIFAVQMLNFQVLPGVSGHLLGGTLAAMLVGPYLGAICVAIVLVVQALIFSDGGVTALGLNITNMALIGTAAGYLLVATLLRVLPRRTWALTATALVASIVSVTFAAQGFVLQYAMGGATDIGRSLGGIAAAMAGTHVLIGIGEGLITAITVGYVAKVRPDLVYAVRNLRRAPREAVAA
ncbi:energy-coupling factor ABC transporter permease [Dactylosporangium fulvum]|uniref:Energy-coupling factor ABC transporter permease n=1 Tax=Dactylosporangium fulvum TaxID=53359 RepID=A0ABY5W5P8_9ACTN|nr:energy-coupling factor ABC transporter permease [Dactylosporangium fulvum]UWP84589.1 energy-coupling factor ABC transporter permease [Dactylosporangium fulvum]